MTDLLDALCKGERRALAKSITLIESTLAEHQTSARQLMAQILPRTGNSLRLGITGVPGVGKSTFIEALGLFLLRQGKSVAVLAVDPSSPVKGGSVLGDKTRMERLSREEKAFIRPSPSSNTLGGVARCTRETILLCEAAGFDVVLVETVGVGQSEYTVASMVDLFLVMMLPNAGDELQGIKRGIMELADLLVVNKADHELVSASKQTQSQYKSALSLIPHETPWEPTVLTCSALESRGIDSVWETLEAQYLLSQTSGYLNEKRRQQNERWFDQILLNLFLDSMHQDESMRQTIAVEKQNVSHGIDTPYSAAKNILETWFNKQKS